MTICKKAKNPCQLSDVLRQINDCNVCSNSLPLPPRPVLQASEAAKLLIIGQAPGRLAHHSRTPWNDPSGERLRAWLDVQRQDFYNASKIALIPMGFCYPGRGTSGDLPPSERCAPLWHPQLLGLINPRLVLLVGQYAQIYYLRDKYTLTERVKRWQNYAPRFMPLPHPSPRNNIWLRRNNWFEQDILPILRQRVRDLLR